MDTPGGGFNNNMKTPWLSLIKGLIHGVLGSIKAWIRRDWDF